MLVFSTNLHVLFINFIWVKKLNLLSRKLRFFIATFCRFPILIPKIETYPGLLLMKKKNQFITPDVNPFWRNHSCYEPEKSTSWLAPLTINLKFLIFHSTVLCKKSFELFTCPLDVFPWNVSVWKNRESLVQRNTPHLSFGLDCFVLLR